jgi:hypothetical protein
MEKCKSQMLPVERSREFDKGSIAFPADTQVFKKQYGGYSVSQLEELLKNCHFLDLVKRPAVWRTGLNWWVEAGKRPEPRAGQKKSSGLSTYTYIV